MAKRVTMSFSLERETLELLDKLVKARGVTRSFLANELLKHAVKEEAMTIQALGNPLVREAFASAFTRPGVLTAMVEAMSEKLEDSQLRLFTDALKDLSKFGEDAAALTPGQGGSAVPVKRSKRGKRR